MYACAGHAFLEVVGAREPMVAEDEVSLLDGPRDHVGRADEPGDERRSGVVVDLRRGPDLLDPSLMHHDDLVRELERFLLIVRHEEAGHVELTVQVVQPSTELLADASIERAEGLVEQQDLRSRRERPSERDPLPLPPES